MSVHKTAVQPTKELTFAKLDAEKALCVINQTILSDIVEVEDLVQQI